MQEDRVKELTQKISETRQGVTEVKATIDTMRSTRDTHMSDMNQLKAAAREQNQRSVACACTNFFIYAATGNIVMNCFKLQT